MPRRLILAWAGFLSLAMWAAVANFIKFAERPAEPRYWCDVKREQAEALAAKIAGEPEADRQRDQQALVWLFLEARERKKAHDAAILTAPARPVEGAYDDVYARRQHVVSVAELMHDCSPEMLTTFEGLVKYGDKRLPDKDPRRFRDYNNLGMICVVLSQNTTDPAYKNDLLAQAAHWLDLAESGFAGGSKVDLVSVIENKLMLAEACENRAMAKQYRTRMYDLLREIDGPAPLVTL
jgi:hypothetical protein